jgi:hypothetical protein
MMARILRFDLAPHRTRREQLFELTLGPHWRRWPNRQRRIWRNRAALIAICSEHRTVDAQKGGL